MPSFKKDNWVVWFLVGVLCLEYLYICGVLLNHYFSWMNAENFLLHPWVYENGHGWKFEDFVRGFDLKMLEYDVNRLTRPVADIMRIVDAKFRANLWNLIPPHPAISCFWPLHLVALPYLLYQFFRNMRCHPAIALSGVGLYIASIGFLTHVVMFFHAGKGMVNIFAVLGLYLGSLIYKQTIEQKGSVSCRSIPRFWLYLTLLFLSVFVALFCDESGMFVPAILLVIFFPLLLRIKEWWVFVAAGILLVVGYYTTLHYFLPYLHLTLRGQVVDVSQCQFFPKLSDFTLSHLGLIIRWLLYDYPHLQLNTANLLGFNTPLYILQVIYTVTMLILFAFFCRSFNGLSVERSSQLRRAFFLTVLFILFYFIILSNHIGAWGVWYYGDLYPLIYCLLLVFILQSIWEGAMGRYFKWFLAVFVAIAIAHSLLFTTYRIDIFDFRKPQYGKFDRDAIFNGQIGPYYRDFNLMDGIRKSDCRKTMITFVWSKVKHKDVQIPQDKIDRCQKILSEDPSFTEESRYVPIEL